MPKRPLSMLVLIAAPVAAHAGMEVAGQFVPPGTGGFYQTTHLADLDGDGKLEILDSLRRTSEQDAPWPDANVGAVRVVEFDPVAGALRLRDVLLPDGGEVVSIGSYDAAMGDRRVAVATDDGVVATFRPREQDPLGRFPLGQRLHSSRFVDADADGATEAIVAGSNGVAALDLATGATLWSRAPGSSRLAVGQLDADPALEVVIEGDVGYVIDGATRAVDWQYAGGFRGALAVGRLGPGGSPGFVSGPLLTSFRSQPYSPLWSVKQNVDQLGAYDIDGDLVDEVVAGNSSTTTIYDSQSQAIVRQFSQGARNLVLGDVDRDGSVEAVGWCSYTNCRGLGVSNLDGTVLASDRSLVGLLSRVAIDDVDADGAADALVAVGGGDSDNSGWLVVLDAVDGRERWRRSLAGIDPSNERLAIRALRAAQLDADAASEIVLAARSSFRTRLVVVDGATRDPQVVNTSDVFEAFEFVSHVEVLATEPRVLTVSKGSTQLRLRRFTSGTLDPQAVIPVPAQYGIAVYDVQVANLDADGAEELLLATAGHLVAFDLDTSTVLWAVPGATAAIGLVEVAPSTPRIARLGPDGGLTLLTFTGAPDSTPVDVGARASAVIGVPGVPGEVFVCADDRVKRVALDDGEVLDLSPGLGAQACRGGDLAAAVTLAGSRVLAGSLVGAFLLEPAGDRLFRDGFE